MSVIAAERIKLTSTRSPWWAAGLAVVATVSVGAIAAVENADREAATVASTQFAYFLGTAVVMVMAVLAVTTEYAVGTIRTTFLAVPRREMAVVAKTGVVAAVAGVVGLICAFGSWGLSRILIPEANLSLGDAAEWRQVAGVGVVYAVAAGMAVAIGILVRHTAGAVALVLVWTLVGERLVAAIPGVGGSLQQWLPFEAAKHFLTAEEGADGTGLLAGPWAAMAYFVVIAAGLWVVAVVVVRRRDA
jgi:ABC-2 type transport system permease protein